jgi:hypothetical protein
MLLHSKTTGANDFRPAHVSLQKISHHLSHNRLSHAAKAHRFAGLHYTPHPFRLFASPFSQHTSQRVGRNPAFERKCHGFRQLIVLGVSAAISGLPHDCCCALQVIQPLPHGLLQHFGRHTLPRTFLHQRQDRISGQPLLARRLQCGQTLQCHFFRETVGLELPDHELPPASIDFWRHNYATGDCRILGRDGLPG